jgi:hypothetical protein
MKYSSIGVVASFTFIYLVSKYCYCDQSGLEPDDEPEVQMNKIDDSITISEDIIKATQILLN